MFVNFNYTIHVSFSVEKLKSKLYYLKILSLK